MRTVTKILYAVLGAVSLIAQFAVSGVVVACTHALQYWAYPVFITVGLALSAFALLIVKYPDDKESELWDRPWFRRLFTLDEKKLSRGMWPWVRRRGTFALVLVTALILGPLFSGLVIRFLGLPERRAWLFAVVSTVIAVVVWISIYLGVLTGLISAASSMMN